MSSGPPAIDAVEAQTLAVPSEQPGELLYQLESIPSNPQPSADTGYVTGSSLTWNLDANPGRYWVPSESYMEVDMSVFGAANLAIWQASLGAAPMQSVAPLAPACLFDSLSLECNGSVIETLTSNIAQHCAFRWRLSNKQEQRASGKSNLWGEADRTVPITAPARAAGANVAARDAADLVSSSASSAVALVTAGAAAYAGAQPDGADGGYYQAAVQVGSQPLPCTQSSYDRQAIFNASRRQTLVFKLPFALCHQPLPLPAGKWTIRAQITNNFGRALQTVADSNNTIVSPYAAGNAVTTATLQIRSLNFMAALSDYGATGITSKLTIIPTNPLYVTTAPLSTSTSTDTINLTGLPKSALRYAFALQRASANSGTANNAVSPTEFHIQRALGRNGVQPAPGAAGTQNTVFGITAFQASIGGKNVPNPQANPRFSADENNMHKWYRQYELGTGLLEAEDYDQWLARGPIWMWPALNIRTPDDRSDTITIRMERDSTAASIRPDDNGALVTLREVPTNLLLFVVSEKALFVTTENGVIKTVNEVDR